MAASPRMAGNGVFLRLGVCGTTTVGYGYHALPRQPARPMQSLCSMLNKLVWQGWARAWFRPAFWLVAAGFILFCGRVHANATPAQCCAALACEWCDCLLKSSLVYHQRTDELKCERGSCALLLIYAPKPRTCAWFTCLLVAPAPPHWWLLACYRWLVMTRCYLRCNGCVGVTPFAGP